MISYRKAVNAKHSLSSTYEAQVNSLGFDLVLSLNFEASYNIMAQLKPRDNSGSYEEAKSFIPKKHEGIKVKTLRFGEYNPTRRPRTEGGRRTRAPSMDK